MPRGRKRKDPDEAPIDGDWTHDVVLNKQKGFAYKLLSPEDILVFKAYGFTREERGPDAAHPVFDIGAETNTPDYTVKGLTLYKAPDAVAARLERSAQARADRNMSTIRGEAIASGGELSTQVHR
jgi:hypothetical protein